MKLTFKEIPLDYVYNNRDYVESVLDAATPIWCFCGKLATGLHVSRCSKYQSKFRSKMVEFYSRRFYVVQVTTPTMCENILGSNLTKDEADKMWFDYTQNNTSSKNFFEVREHNNARFGREGV
jgi:hypothetical protein